MSEAAEADWTALSREAVSCSGAAMSCKADCASGVLTSLGRNRPETKTGTVTATTAAANSTVTATTAAIKGRTASQSLDEANWNSAKPTCLNTLYSFQYPNSSIATPDDATPDDATP